MKAYIDPRSTINYSSYYIYGLHLFLGRKNVCFSSVPFKDLNNIDILMAFVIMDEGIERRFIIDYRDQRDIIADAYQWTDVYAKINVHAKETICPDGGKKLKNIPPSFAANIWSMPVLLWYLFRNFFKAKIFAHFKSPNIHLRPQIWIRNYLGLLKRQRLQEKLLPAEFSENKDLDNYVFFVSTLWSKSTETNLYRSHYILSCARNKEIDFHGGFFVNSKQLAEVPQKVPSNLLYYKYMPNKVYQAAILKSVFVFNTPAVHQCHGWKLAEYLYMGKAIISTPLSNELPVPLQHGKELYIVNNKQELDDAIALLLKDKQLRINLRKNARAYYDRYASPVQVISQIITGAYL